MYVPTQTIKTKMAKQTDSVRYPTVPFRFGGYHTHTHALSLSLSLIRSANVHLAPTHQQEKGTRHMSKKFNPLISVLCQLPQLVIHTPLTRSYILSFPNAHTRIHTHTYAPAECKPNPVPIPPTKSMGEKKTRSKENPVRSNAKQTSRHLSLCIAMLANQSPPHPIPSSPVPPRHPLPSSSLSPLSVNPSHSSPTLYKKFKKQTMGYVFG